MISQILVNHFILRLCTLTISAKTPSCHPSISHALPWHRCVALAQRASASFFRVCESLNSGCANATHLYEFQRMRFLKMGKHSAFLTQRSVWPDSRPPENRRSSSPLPLNTRVAKACRAWSILIAAVRKTNDEYTYFIVLNMLLLFFSPTDCQHGVALAQRGSAAFLLYQKVVDPRCANATNWISRRENEAFINIKLVYSSFVLRTAAIRILPTRVGFRVELQSPNGLALLWQRQAREYNRKWSAIEVASTQHCHRQKLHKTIL